MRPVTRSLRRLTALAALLFAAGATLEPLTITGRVVDANSGRPLEAVQISVPALGIGALTNADGRYVLTVPDRAVGSGALEVRVDLIGFASQTAALRPAEFLTDSSRTLDFRLESTAVTLQEVVVTGSASKVRVPSRVEAVEREAMRGTSADAAAVAVTLPAAAPVDHLRRSDDRGPDREQYAYIAENGFRSVADHPLSTFSTDVDRASYSNVRRFLMREHRLPPVDAVQVEEMINYFPYEYELPRDGRPVAITTELGHAPWRDGHRLLRIGVASAPIETAQLPPSNLVFLLDVSGSMNSPDKLPLVKRSIRPLVEQLREQDRVAIVVYAGAAGLVLEPTSGAHRGRILEAIDRLEAGGSTAGGAGLQLAYAVARRHFVRNGNNRVILATDGDFNVGESSDAAMTRLVEEKRREGTFLTVLGFGTGNLQSTKMQQIAQNGNGNFAYIDGLDEARKVLVGEMGGTLVTVAKDVKIQVEFNPRRVQSYRLIGYENRLLATEDFNDDRKDAGEIGAGHTVTALYEIVPVGRDSDVGSPSVDPLRYQAPAPARNARNDDGELAFVKVRYKDPHGTESRLIERPVEDRIRRPSVDFRFASAVAGFGMILRESEHRGSITSDEVLRLAEEGLGRDAEGYRRGFLDLVWAYQSLTGATEDGDYGIR